MQTILLAAFSYLFVALFIGGIVMGVLCLRGSAPKSYFSGKRWTAIQSEEELYEAMREHGVRMILSEIGWGFYAAYWIIDTYFKIKFFGKIDQYFDATKGLFILILPTALFGILSWVVPSLLEKYHIFRKR